VAFGIEMGEVVDVEWRLGLPDVNDHDLTVWIATADHDPAGVQEPVDAFGGETVDALTDGHRAGDRVEETMIPAWVSTSTVCRRRALPARVATRPVPNNSATVITWATESIRREWWGWSGRSPRTGRPRAPNQPGRPTTTAAATTTSRR
jgi:hypothetical protein